MADYITLLGAEQIQSAANTMSNAASEMLRAASSVGYAFDSHQRFMDDWLLRFETVLNTVAEQQ